MPLLSGPAAAFDRIAGAEQSDWLLSVAHDVCDPVHSRGVLYVETTSNQWRHITTSEALTASRYLYELPPNILIGLSKISLRNNKSRTNTTGDAGTMRNRVLERDKETCWITAATDGSININSHICPKRMGDAQGAQVLRTFCNVQTPTASVFHPMFGITLNKILDGFFDLYNMGFRRIGWPVSTLACEKSIPAIARYSY
jgi:hypothetical protein